jgi:hypothetical protein
MLKFASLSLAQKRFVVSMIEANPALRQNPKVTLKDCSAHYNEMAAKRDTTGIKLGVPNWLFKANKVERGVYQLPVPNDMELSDYAKQLTQTAAYKTKTAKVKAPKVVKAKVTKVKATKVVDQEDAPIAKGRLAKIIDESVAYDDDVEDFNEILRQNGIEV